MYKIISSGSTGNAIIYHETIMVDCGVPFSALKSHYKKLQIVLLTHVHSDHINIQTLRKLMFERPTLRIGCCEWMRDHVKEFKNVDFFEIGKLYDYGLFQVSPVKLFHDVENCGYRLLINSSIDGQLKIFHATDTCHLEGIEAKGYDLYALETNYNEDTVGDVISDLQAKGQYAHQRGSVNSHLSEQQANDFFYKNKGPNSKMISLHVSKSFI